MREEMRGSSGRSSPESTQAGRLEQEEAGPAAECVWKPAVLQAPGMEGWDFCGLEQFREAFPCLVFSSLYRRSSRPLFTSSFPGFSDSEGNMGPSSQLTRLR